MLSKAPAVPQLLTNGSDEETNKLTPPDISGEHAGNAAEGVDTSGSSSGSANTEPAKPDSESRVTENIVQAQSDVIPRDSVPRVVAAPQNPAVTVQKPKHDRLFTLAAFGLTLAIMALVIKKFFKINGLAGYIEGKF
jgi:ubiquitin-conjugating enzyme E2 J1